MSMGNDLNGIKRNSRAQERFANAPLSIRQSGVFVGRDSNADPERGVLKTFKRASSLQLDSAGLSNTAFLVSRVLLTRVQPSALVLTPYIQVPKAKRG